MSDVTTPTQPRKRGRPPNPYGTARAIGIRLYPAEMRALDAMAAATDGGVARSSMAANIVVGVLVDEGYLPENWDPEAVDAATTPV